MVTNGNLLQIFMYRAGQTNTRLTSYCNWASLRQHLTNRSSLGRQKAKWNNRFQLNIHHFKRGIAWRVLVFPATFVASKALKQIQKTMQCMTFTTQINTLPCVWEDGNESRCRYPGKTARMPQPLRWPPLASQIQPYKTNQKYCFLSSIYKSAGYSAWHIGKLIKSITYMLHKYTYMRWKPSHMS